MNITVHIPTPLRRFADGGNQVQCSAANMAELLEQLEQRFPQMGTQLKDETGKVRPFVNFYVNDEDIRFLGGNEYQFREGDEVLIVPSIAGGR
jgi:molybdopterin converting factor small subunit